MRDGSGLGYYTNTVKTEWPAGEPRSMVLLEDVSFIEPDGKIWTAPAGFRPNGLDIPRLLWPVEGSPFVGLARRASVLHDRYCVCRTETWQATHRMFFHAMRADGVDLREALRKYKAVYFLGPRWDANGHDIWPKTDNNERYL